jgi:sulfur carrier protein ThiS adenylyltransferase
MRDPASHPSAGPTDQAEVITRLSSSVVGIIGLGGLGSNAAMMLARSGVRRFVLADFDRVERGNLNRQLYFEDQIGRPKTDALAETLRRIQPGIELRIVGERVEPGNLARLFAGVDVLLEAVDSAEDKAMIVATAADELRDVPLVWTSGLAGCGSANSIRTLRVGDGVWVVGDLEADIRDGLPLLAPRVMVAAAHQAHIAARILLGMPDA